MRYFREIIGTSLLLVVLGLGVSYYNIRVDSTNPKTEVLKSGNLSNNIKTKPKFTWGEAVNAIDKSDIKGYNDNSKISKGFRSLFIEAPFEVMEDFGRHNWSPAEVSFLDYETGNPDLDKVRAQVRGRGNTTWAMGEASASRPLRLRLQETANMTGKGNSRSYILLASSNEKSHFRNWVALTLASHLKGLDFVPSAEFVNVYFNNRFIGVYLLTDERDIEPHRSPVITNKVPSRSEFLLEKDSRASGLLNYDYFIADSYRIKMKEPSGIKDASEGHGRVATDLVEEFTSVLRQSAETDDFKLFKSYFDVDSFIDFYLLYYSLGVVDFGGLSVWFEIRFSDGGKLGELSGLESGRRVYMGPVWDFDVMAGIKPEHFGLEDEIRSEWLSNALKITEFNKLFNERAGILLEVLPDVQKQAEQLIEYNSFNLERSYEMGRKAIMVRNSQEPTELEDDLSELFQWLNLRFEWIKVNKAQSRAVPQIINTTFLNKPVRLEALRGQADLIPVINLALIHDTGSVEWVYDQEIIISFETFALSFETGSELIKIQAGRFESKHIKLSSPVKLHNGYNVISSSDLGVILESIEGLLEQ
jgi:hypothetical protein